MRPGSYAGNSPSLLLGTVVAERYFVEERLGEGGMGTVFRARHITLDKRVALKVLHGEYSGKADLVERFLQEAKSASRIRNPHVIDITDFGVAEGFVFFAMEYLEGQDLHSLLAALRAKGEVLSWRRARNIFLQVCSALTAAHKEGVIHRDLKPENIFLVATSDDSDYVKLLDFGIAKIQNNADEQGRRLTKTGMIFGTPEYMAPEQARGEEPDHRVDVYAMGCLLYQLLTGEVPFTADTFMAVLAKHMSDPVPSVGSDVLEKTGAPLGLVRVVHKALAKRREDRFESIEALSEAVRRAPNSTGRRARPTSSVPIDNWTGAVRSVEDLAPDLPVPSVRKKSRVGRFVLASCLIAVPVLVWQGTKESPVAALSDSEARDAGDVAEPSGEPASPDAGTAVREPAVRTKTSNEPPARRVEDRAPQKRRVQEVLPPDAGTKAKSPSTNLADAGGARKSGDARTADRAAKAPDNVAEERILEPDFGEDTPSSDRADKEEGQLLNEAEIIRPPGL